MSKARSFASEAQGLSDVLDTNGVVKLEKLAGTGTQADPFEGLWGAKVASMHPDLHVTTGQYYMRLDDGSVELVDLVVGYGYGPNSIIPRSETTVDSHIVYVKMTNPALVTDLSWHTAISTGAPSINYTTGRVSVGEQLNSGCGEMRPTFALTFNLHYTHVQSVFKRSSKIGQCWWISGYVYGGNPSSALTQYGEYAKTYQLGGGINWSLDNYKASLDNASCTWASDVFAWNNGAAGATEGSFDYHYLIRWDYFEHPRNQYAVGFRCSGSGATADEHEVWIGM